MTEEIPESLQQIAAMFRGNKTDAEMEAWRFIRGACRDGSHCADCRKAFDPSEPLWRVRKNMGRGYMIVPVCFTCFKATYVPAWGQGKKYYVYNVRQYLRRSEECEGCGRPVHDPWPTPPNKERVFCCGDCQHKAELRSHRRGRAEARSGRQCDECGEVYDPTRSDGKFCGPACKQKAYRKRRPLK